VCTRLSIDLLKSLTDWTIDRSIVMNDRSIDCYEPWIDGRCKRSIDCYERLIDCHSSGLRTFSRLDWKAYIRSAVSASLGVAQNQNSFREIKCSLFSILSFPSPEIFLEVQGGFSPNPGCFKRSVEAREWNFEWS